MGRRPQAGKHRKRPKWWHRLSADRDFRRAEARLRAAYEERRALEARRRKERSNGT